MSKKVIIITSRDYFTCKSVHESTLSNDLLNLLIKSLKIPEEKIKKIDESLQRQSATLEKRNEVITQMLLRNLFASKVDDVLLRSSINTQWKFAAVRKILVSDSYVIYLAPCLPRAVPGENFKDRQDYVASVVNMCIEDLGQEIAPESIYLLAHDNDMISDPVDRAIVEKDIIVDSKLKSLLSEKKIFIDNIYVFIHSLSTCKIYELLVNKLSNSDVIIPEMCLNAIEIIEGGRCNVDILQKFDECQHDVASFYNSLN